MNHPVLAELQHLGLAHTADEVYGEQHAERFVEDMRVLQSLVISTPSNILEIAPYVGWISIQLKKLGHSVSTVQPEHHQSQFQRRYDYYGIATKCAVFPRNPIPYAPASFDLVVFCETLEHFAFNPVSVLQDILRSLKPGGVLYLTTPNQATLRNGLKLISGRPINEPVKSFFYNPASYDPQGHLDLGMHWREYTMSELCALLTLVGFSVKRRRFRMYRSTVKTGPPIKDFVRGVYRGLYNLAPSLIGEMLEIMAERPRAV